MRSNSSSPPPFDNFKYKSLVPFFEVDAKHIVLATLHALAGEKPAEKKDGGEGVSAKLLEKAIRDLGIDPEKRNPAIS